MKWKTNLMRYYAFNTRSVYDFWLAPKVPVCVQGLSGQKLTIANTYNRIGGQLEKLATQNNMDPAVALGVWSVETTGSAFGSDGTPIIRFENHILYGEWGSTDPTTYDQYFQPRTGSLGHKVNLSGQCGNSGWTLLHPAGYSVTGDYFQCLQYTALRLAQTRAGDTAAYRSISMGGPQIMGFNSGDLVNPTKSDGSRYGSASEMFNVFSQNELSHVNGFFDYMRNHTTCKRRLDDSSKCQLDSSGNPILAVPMQFAHTGQEDWYQLTATYNGTADKQSSYEGAYLRAREVLNLN